MRAGMLDLLIRYEDVLAWLLAHEVAHVVARHTADELSMRLMMYLGFIVFNFLYTKWLTTWILILPPYACAPFPRYSTTHR